MSEYKYNSLDAGCSLVGFIVLFLYVAYLFGAKANQIEDKIDQIMEHHGIVQVEEKE